MTGAGQSQADMARQGQAQRWCLGRDRYRPVGELIRTTEYDVAPILTDGPAKAFVQEHHYSGSYPAARARFGLYHHGALVGVAVFSHPCNQQVLRAVFGPASAVELGRFVLLDEVPGNGETWFLGRCFAQLRSVFAGVLSFSDPVPRTNRDGLTVFPGHYGGIYQAHNAAYLGRATSRLLWLLPDGRVFSDRAIQKIRGLERGWHHCAAQLERFGAETFNGPGWLAKWFPAIGRRLAHPGNHRYAWNFRNLLAGQPYPKSHRGQP